MDRRTVLKGALALAAAPAPVFAQGAAVTLDFPSWQAEEPGVSGWWRALIAEFETANPGAKVNLYSIPFTQYVQQLTVRFAGNNAPDIVHLPTRNFAAFASQGWLAPMDERLARTDILQNWTPLQSEMKWEGKTQGLLLMGYGSLLYYNEKLLAEAGVGVPTTPAASAAAAALTATWRDGAERPVVQGSARGAGTGKRAAAGQKGRADGLGRSAARAPT